MSVPSFVPIHSKDVEISESENYDLLVVIALHLFLYNIYIKSKFYLDFFFFYDKCIVNCDF